MYYGHTIILILLVVTPSVNTVTKQSSTNQKANPQDECKRCTSPNVRTVLFIYKDLHPKKCWTSEETALLFNRAILQDILPRTLPRNLPLLLDYFKDCLRTVKKQTKNVHVRMLIIRAMVDVIGGYLHTYALPLIKRTFYEGCLEYEVISEFFILHKNIKTILDTDGSGWSRPMRVKNRLTPITPLRIGKADFKDSCGNLYTINTCDCSLGRVFLPKLNSDRIPLPVLDDDENPNAIAVPIYGRMFFSLQDKCSLDVVLNYYVKCIQCLKHLPSNCKCNIQEVETTYFDFRIYNWIMSKVMPRIEDDKFYVGFSSIFRVLATIREKGMPVDDNGIPYSILNNKTFLTSKYESYNESSNIEISPTLLIMITPFIILLVLCFCTTVCLIRYHIMKKRRWTKVMRLTKSEDIPKMTPPFIMIDRQPSTVSSLGSKSGCSICECKRVREKTKSQERSTITVKLMRKEK